MLAQEVDRLPAGKAKGVGMCVGPIFSSTPTGLDWLQYYAGNRPEASGSCLCLGMCANLPACCLSGSSHGVQGRLLSALIPDRGAARC